MVTSAATGTPFEHDLEAHRRALTGYCYRMLGSGSEAEDAVQETMVRAWRGAERLQARAALKSWLYRIASNVCLDMLQGSQRRAQPMDLGPASGADSSLGDGLPEHAWVQPIANARLLGAEADPAQVAESRDTLRLAFVAALQRARATLDDLDLDSGAPASLAEEDQELLTRYVEAFERYDIASLVSLLRADATFSMPPFPLWLRGPDEVGRFMLGTGIHCKGSRLLPTSANGGPAVGVYHPAGPGAYEPWAIIVLEMSGGRIAGLHHFLYPELFAEFGLPARLES